MTKDRAAPFSKKHRKYWIPVTGGMILIGLLNVGLGMMTYTPPPARNDRIELVIPPSPYTKTWPVDAGVDALPADAAVVTPN